MSQCTRCSPRRPCLSHTRIPFGDFGPKTFKKQGKKWGYYPTTGQERITRLGKTFDEVPLGYLDWLSAQDWVYGELRTRLTQYLNNPPIQKELAEMFPVNPDVEPYNFEPTHQRREPMPKTVDVQDWKPMPQWYTMPFWEAAADYLIFFESAEDPNTLLDIDFEHVKEVCRKLPQVKDKLVAAYKEFRQRMRQAKAEPVRSVYYWHNRLRSVAG